MAGSLLAATLHLPSAITAEATGPDGAAVSFDVSGTGEGPDDENGRPLDSANVVCAPASGSVFPLGTTIVDCTATDNNQNTTSGSFTVTVRDTTGPVLQLPNGVSVRATSAAGAVVGFNTAASDLVDGTVAVHCSPASGSQFIIGTTTVDCSASDTRGNQSSGSFDVIVTEQPPPPDPPDHKLPDDITAEATGPAGAVVTYSATSSGGPDDENGRPINTLDCSPKSGSVFALGTTDVHCTSNNTSAGSFKVHVRDTTGPALRLPRGFTVQATSANGATVNYNATAEDLVDGTVAVDCSPASGSQFAIGTTTVNCSAADTRGNQSSDSFEVTVSNQPPPDDPPGHQIPDDITAEATGPAGAIVSYSATGAGGPDDENGRPMNTLDCTPASGSQFALGTTTVSCSANGTPVGSFLVHVVDTTAPVLDLPDDITTTATSASGAAVSFTATASDLVDGDIAVDCTPASGSTFAIGTTAVQCSASDTRGNGASGAFNVTVNENNTQPLTIVVTANPSTLWPPDHKMVAVTVTVTATNGAAITAQIVSVSSNEPDDNQTSPDWVITGPLTVDLRSEKNDQAGQREYTIVVDAVDGNGTHAAGSTKVIVTNEASASLANPDGPALHDPKPKAPRKGKLGKLPRKFGKS